MAGSQCFGHWGKRSGNHPKIIFVAPDMRLGCPTTSSSLRGTRSHRGRYAASALKPGWLDAEEPVAAEQPPDCFRLNAATLRYTAR